MRITRFECRTVNFPPPKRRSLPRADDPEDIQPESSRILVVQLTTDDGPVGTGWVVTSHPRVVQTIIEDVFGPLTTEADPQLTERIYAKAKQRCSEITRGGCEAVAYAAIDLAIWDIKSQANKLPLHQLLGGARESAPAYIAETARPGLSADQVIEIARPLLDDGLNGLWVGVHGRDPIRDANKLQHVRDQLGDDIWFGVCGHHGLDLHTALAFGRFLEEEMDADVYCDPCPGTDLEAYGRLATELELAVAAGTTLGFDDAVQVMLQTRVTVLRPDIARLGGITPLLKIAALAETHRRIVMPVGHMDVTSQLACGLPAVTAVDLNRRADSFRVEPLQLVDGQVFPSNSANPVMKFC